MLQFIEVEMQRETRRVRVLCSLYAPSYCSLLPGSARATSLAVDVLKAFACAEFYQIMSIVLGVIKMRVSR